MDNAQAEYNLEKQFSKDCVGKQVCSMFIDYKKMFSQDCQDEIQRRHNGIRNYGPSKVYAIAQCEIETVSFMGNVMTR